MKENIIVGASVYTGKFFINPLYKDIPEQVLEELREIAIIYAQKLHCYFSVNFDDEGNVYFETRAEDWDINFDDIGARLDINKIINEKEELLNSLKLWYRVFILEEEIDEILEHYGEENENQ